MMYFIPWCVFLGAVILAVPIASMMENRKRVSPMDSEVTEEEWAEGEAEEPAAEFAEEGEVEAEPLADDAVAGNTRVQLAVGHVDDEDEVRIQIGHEEVGAAPRHVFGVDEGLFATAVAVHPVARKGNGQRA